MATIDRTTDRIGLRYGIMTGIIMVVYFLILVLLGAENKEEARMAAYIFIILGVMMAIVRYKKVHGNVMPYLPGLGVGFVLGLVSSLIYGIGIMIYSAYFDSDFDNTLRTNDYFGGLSPLMLFAAYALMGLIVGAFSSYILMMLYDKSGGNTASSDSNTQ